MTISSTPDHSPVEESQDAKIERLEWLVESFKEEAAWHERQTEIAAKTAFSLIDVVNEFFSSFNKLLNGYSQLTNATTEAATNINKHYIEYKKGRTFDPEYVRIQVAAFTNGVTSSSGAMSSAVGEVQTTFNLLRSSQEKLLEELAKRPPSGDEVAKG